MKLPALKLCILVLLLNACQEPAKQPPPSNEPQVNDTSFIPVTDYIKGEIKAVADLPVGILKRVTGSGKPDSVFIKWEEFNQLAQDFLPAELNKENFERSFTESSFMDQTTESLTFTYQSKDSGSRVRRVDVLIAPSLQMDKIKSIYIEKGYKAGDTAVEQKMFWKGGQHFQVITVRSVGGKSPGIQQLKVIWDPQQY